MSIGDLYPAVLGIVLTGLIIGIGIIMLDKFSTVAMNVSGNHTGASLALNSTRSGINDFVTWIPVIILVVAAAVILGLILRSFMRKEAP